jgi:hypothetical protein
MEYTKGLEGLDVVIRNLNKEIVAIKNRSMGGLIKGAALVRRDMDITSPLIPVYTNNLRSSWFTIPVRIEANMHQIPALKVGFTASYAVFVHENVGANFGGRPDKVKFTKSGKPTAATKKFFRRPGAGAKFFEASLNRNATEVLRIIREEAKIKK